MDARNELTKAMLTFSGNNWPKDDRGNSHARYAADVVETRVARMLGDAEVLYIEPTLGDRATHVGYGATVFAESFIIIDEGAGEVSGAGATGDSHIIPWSALTGVTLRSAFDRAEEADGGLIFTLQFATPSGRSVEITIDPKYDAGRLAAPKLLDFAMNQLAEKR